MTGRRMTKIGDYSQKVTSLVHGYLDKMPKAKKIANPMKQIYKTYWEQRKFLCQHPQKYRKAIFRRTQDWTHCELCGEGPWHPDHKPYEG